MKTARGYWFVVALVIAVFIGGIWIAVRFLFSERDVLVIDTKQELMHLLTLDDLDCKILDIRRKATENNMSSNVVVTVNVPSKYIREDERFNTLDYDEMDYETEFNVSSFSTQQFDKVGVFFDQVEIVRGRKTLYIPYQVCWGASYNSNEDCNVVLFFSDPHKVAIKIDEILAELKSSST